MRFIFVINILAASVLAQPTYKACSFNELCVDVRSCPAYKQYGNLAYSNWPVEIQQKAKTNLCNVKKLEKKQEISVCCPTGINGESCGIHGDDRIVGYGQRARVFEFPWMALLQTQKGRFVCGGSLISSRYVLTAAHCVKFERIVSVRLGENDISKPIDCNNLGSEEDCAPEPQDINIEKMIPHPLFSNRYKRNDIALIRLQHPAQLGPSVRPICLPNGTPMQQMESPPLFFVSGWGRTENGSTSDVLLYARVPSVPLEECSSRLRRLNNDLKLDNAHVCAGGVNMTGNCPGDSGGPLQFISSQTARFVQQGVVAFGLISCGAESEPGVYTKVVEFLSWIVENVDE